jgi:hypothetical protein
MEISDDEDDEWEVVKEKTPELILPFTRSQRLRRFPAKYKDCVATVKKLPHIPKEKTVISNSNVPPLATPTSASVVSEPEVALPQPEKALLAKTAANDFGIFRVWRKHPGTEPPKEDDSIYVNIPTFAYPFESPTTPAWWKGFGQLRNGLRKDGLCAPFKNASVMKLVRHYYTSFRDASIAGFNSFVKNVLKAPDFRLEDIPDNFDLRAELKKLDNTDDNSTSPFSTSAVWKEATVSIPLPAEGQVHESEATAPQLKVNGVLHRDIIEVIRLAFTHPDSESYHYTPTQAFWKPTPESKPERIYSEVYDSDAFWEEHERIMASNPPSDGIQTAVAAIMLYSDSTHLANFGSASLWPFYLYLGNQSKYERAQPSQYAAHHLAYIPYVSRQRRTPEYQ